MIYNESAGSIEHCCLDRNNRGDYLNRLVTTIPPGHTGRICISTDIGYCRTHEKNGKHTCKPPRGGICIRAKAPPKRSMVDPIGKPAGRWTLLEKTEEN